MKHLLTITMSLLLLTGKAQQTKYVSLAVFNTQNAMPFGKFKGLFTDGFHPGFEIGYGKTIKAKEKHEWLTELKFAYFFHRFVQHGMPLRLTFGYRYKINQRLSAETFLGAGYMHSLPATAKLRLDENGEYKNNKGVGRMQAIATFDLGVSYIATPKAKRPVRIFSSYQQRLQFPFVKSYVQLLPYNSFVIGISRQLK